MATKPRPSTIGMDALGLAAPGAAPTRGTALEDLPRAAQPVAPGAKPAASAETAPAKGGGGLKAMTVGTTLYLLPAESKRIKRVALDHDCSVHELVLMALDRLLVAEGEPPIERYRGTAKG